MALFIAGLLLFLGVHSLRIVADGWRSRMLARLGQPAWKGAYALLSLLGFALMVVGFGLARQTPQQLWMPPLFLRHVSGLLVLLAFVLLAAAYVPHNSIKAKLHHPMLLAVKLWALAHLLSNSALHDVLLFGAFLLWAVLCFRAARQRDRVAGTRYPAGRAGATIVTVFAGLAGWALFAFWLHGWLIGVRPFG
ncbi:MAG: NnrU family protein [Sphingomonadaceae bacterium]